MNNNELLKEKLGILIVDDDDDDRALIKEAFEVIQVHNPLCFLENGQNLMDYLFRRGEYSSKDEYYRPGLILLDLNMPRKDGREALKEIKSHPALKCIPVAVFTTSTAQEDILLCYSLGVNTFITKPVTFNSLVEMLRVLTRYWFEIAVLPPVVESQLISDK